MIRADLPTHWTLTSLGPDAPPKLREREVAATVPGSVHTDLLAAGLIPDPFFGSNETALGWIGLQTWRYETTFRVDAELLAHTHLELVCEGLDTVATLELNGTELGRTESMHVAHRFSVRELVDGHGGDNRLTITFSSPLAYARAQLERLGYLPTSEYPHPFNFIRKMACNFGWDWGPDLVTAGIWRPLYLEAWTTARVGAVRPLVLSASAAAASLEVHADCVGDTGGLEVHASLRDPNGESVAWQTAAPTQPLRLEVANPRLWWPRGHGESPLYTLSVELREGERVLEAVTRRVGLRQVRLDTAPDEIGSPFTLELNGKKIFCKGANWIPDDAFPHRVTPERYRARIEAAADAGMNMLRVWGGGIYESDAFYDVCDELGIMVWQDFLFACAAYPEEEPFASLVEAEARYHIARLSPHASLVLWNGCNENFWGYADWATNGKTWREWTEGRTWGKGFYLGLLPRIVTELDPSRPYSPGSPYSNSPSVHPLDDRHGTLHMWDTWNHADYTAYRNYLPRFASEFGFQAPASYATLASVIPETQLTPLSETMLHHQKANDGQGKLHRRLEEHFSLPSSFTEWLYATQLNQARALQTGIEWFRALAPRCMGTLYWQLNDLWPVVSWSAIDSQGRKKLLWYATRRFFADRLLTVQPEGDKLVLCVINDHDRPWRGTARLRRRNFRGDTLDERLTSFEAAPRSVVRLPIGTALTSPQDPHAELLYAEAGDARALWFFEVDKHLNYPEPKFGLELEPTPYGYDLTITAHAFLRDLCVLADLLDPDAVVSEQLVTLFPGETGCFEIISRQPLTRELLLNEPVLHTANTLSTAKGGGF